MFSDPTLLTKLNNVFAAETDLFDELLVAAGLDPKKDLIGADLSGANFAGCTIDGWNLSRCDLTGASFVGAKVRNLVTTDAVGVDLTGAETLQDPSLPEEDSAVFNSLIDRIRESAKAATRWPFIERLLKEYGSDKRTWDYLLNVHLRRERVGKFVSRIIDEWESTQAKGEGAGNKLRIALLRESRTGYITVRARLIRELAGSMGPRREVFDLCKMMIEHEGYFTSGIAAMSILAHVFRLDEDAADVLRNAIEERVSVSKYDAVTALLEGFDNPGNRRFVEAAILDAKQQSYHRAGMLRSYARHCRHSAALTQLAIQIFRTSTEPWMREVALDVRASYGDLVGPEQSTVLQDIARNDGEERVRRAALTALSSRGVDQLPFILTLAQEDSESAVRAAAVNIAVSLGFKDREWFSYIFEHDEAEVVRQIGLDRLLRDDEAKDDRRLRSLLIKEIARPEPRYLAVIPSPTDQNPCAHWRNPMDMMRQG